MKNYKNSYFSTSFYLTTFQFLTHFIVSEFFFEFQGGYCTVESIVSGPGLVNVFHFCNASNDIPSLLLDDLDRKDCPARIVQGVTEKNR